MDAFAWREIERIASVLTGGLSMYLGFRLFLALPELKPGEGRMHLPGGISIHLSRVGPGVFFALFGSILVALSFHYPVKVSEVGQTPDGVKLTRSFNGLGEIGGASDATGRIQALSDLATLNTAYLPALRSDISKERRNDLEGLMMRAKLAIMRNAWGPDWGDAEAFRDWVITGAADPVPPALKPAAEAYRRTGG